MSRWRHLPPERQSWCQLTRLYTWSKVLEWPQSIKGREEFNQGWFYKTLITKSVLDPPEGEATCSTPAVANSLSPSGETVRAGVSVNFTCHEGFQLDGAQQITCGPDGQWRPLPPQCLRTYVPTQLPDKDSEFAFLQVALFFPEMY